LYLSPFTQKLSFLYHRQSLYQTWLSSTLSVLTRRVSLVEQEQLTLPEHLSSPPGFSGVRVTRSLGLYVCFVDRCLSFCTFSFSHCVVCSSSIYGFWFFGIFKLFLRTGWLLRNIYISNGIVSSSFYTNVLSLSPTKLNWVARWVS
jgi:hypothetical protein